MPIVLLWLTLSFTGKAWTIDAADLLPPDEAFQFDAELASPDKILLTWDIADGYYLYRQKFKFVSSTPEVRSGQPLFPSGQIKNDRYLGSVEVYRDHLEVVLPLQRLTATPIQLILETTFQGCADIGVCYMPIQKTMSFDLP